MSDEIILVDDKDNATGFADKMETHRRGLLHRAFSIFLFDPDGRCLLQRRAPGKYHSGGLWSNACCSHPRRGEDMAAALQRRLEEEIGVACALGKVLEIAYDLDVGNGLREHEYNHTYAGTIAPDTALTPNPEEASELRWASRAEIERELASNPERFTPWFRLLFPKVILALARAEGKTRP